MSSSKETNNISKEREKVKKYYKDLSEYLSKNIIISSVSEAIEYLGKLNDLMNYYSSNLDEIGQLKDYLHNQLAVGTDSQYSEKLHFLYELVQNVDDCSFKDAANCNLTVSFDNKNNTISLEYNELGFTTENVFAISSIANTTKNKVDESVMQIGEKGIGFKSVFGIAKKVLIQSGYFSFSFYTEDFIIPVPEYDNFSYTPGTKLTLYLMENEASNLFTEIMIRYDHGKNLGEYLNDNPVVFLNKLTSICYKNTQGDFIKFGVSREDITADKFTVEKDVTISIEKKIKRAHDAFKLNCYRFSKDVIYNRSECKSRYPKSDFVEKRHRIVAIAPRDYKFKGSVYSFLPTKIKTNVPIIFHIPFKLKASREDIDNQDNNAWFRKTMLELERFIEPMYTQLSKLEATRILNYIPTKEDSNIFSQHNYSSNCFRRKSFLLEKPSKRNYLNDNYYNDSYGKYINELKIYLGADRQYHELYNTVYVKDIDNNLAQPILNLLEKNTAVISADESIKLSEYGVKEDPKLINQLSNHYLSSPNNNSIMMLFDNIDVKDIQSQINLATSPINQNGRLFISTDKVKHIYSYKNYKTIFMDRVFVKDSDKTLTISDDYRLANYEMVDSKMDFIYQSIKPYAEKEMFGIVFRLAKLQFKKISFLKEDDYILTKDTFYYSDIIKSITHYFDVLSKISYLNSQETMGMAFIRIEADAYDFKHNIKDNTDDPETFINKINQRNSYSKRTLGSTYEKILRIIDNASVSRDVYINEILQNANDADYEGKQSHVFALKLVKNDLIATYNEKGFTKEDIRAITDIGESTKIQVVESEGKTSKIGEKGIGFKTVFKIAKSVDIHSGEYHFSMDKKSPTIPNWIPKQEKQNGTKIVLHLEKLIDYKYDDSEIVNLILGLNNIDEFHIFDKNIIVERKKYQRNYLVNDKLFEYYVYKHSEPVEENALRERRINKPNESPTQEVEVIFPKNIKKADSGTLYCGLPTSVKTVYPFSINAHFELNTSREGIVCNEWNNELICIVSLGILKSYEVLRDLIGLDILQYLTIGPVISDNQNYFRKDYNMLGERLKKRCLLKNVDGEWIPLKNAVVVDRLEIDVLEAYEETVDDDYVLSDDLLKYNCKAILKQLGVTFHTDNELFDELIENLKIYEDLLIDNKEIREKFYSFINNYPKKDQLFEYFRDYPLVPCKFENHKIEFVSINKDLYYSLDKKSPIYSEQGLYYILDADILDVKTYNDIMGEKAHLFIQKFGDEEVDRYQGQRIKNWINSIEDLVERAEKILNEYNRNRSLMRRVFNELDNDTRKRIVFKMQDDSYEENRYLLYIHKKTNTVFDEVLITEEYWEIASDLNRPLFLDLAEANEYPFKNITAAQIESLLNFEFKDRYSLVYSLIEYNRFDEELLKCYLFPLIRFAGRPNIEVLKGCSIDNIPVFIDNNSDLVENISVNCDSITFSIENDLTTEDTEEFSSLLEEIVFDIDSSPKLDTLTKESIYSWINSDSLCQSDLKNTVFIRTDEGCNILLGRNVKTEKQVYEIIEAFLKKHFNYSLTFNKTINTYNRYLIKRIGNNKYELKDALQVSDNIDPEFNNIEEEKRLLCEPYEFKRIVYGGYAKRCPCCGARVHTELTGFRIAKLRQTYGIGDSNYNILIDMPCCQNCFDAFTYADDYEIDIDALIEEGLVSMHVNLAGETWWPNRFKPRLAHMGLIIAMNDELYDYLQNKCNRK